MIEHVRTTIGQPLPELVRQLRSSDSVQREWARDRLVELGKLASPALVRLLRDPSPQVRAEAAKTLIEIADPATVLPLIEAMDDAHEDVRWAASEAVVALGFDALRPLLSAMIDRSDSTAFYRSAHQVLSRLADRQRSREIQRVVEALQDEEPQITVPLAAGTALERLHLI